jgi:hypothetical protein
MSNDPGTNNKVTTDLVQALRQAGQELARQISDASALQVQTFFTVVGENTEPVLVASTKIELDGDTETVVPLKREGDTLVRDLDLLELHQTSVENAIAYRDKLVDQILDIARQARTR